MTLPAKLVIGDVLVVAREETPEGDDALYVLGDLLDVQDPDEAEPDLAAAEAALILFGEGDFGPPAKALRWMHYAQRSLTDLAPPTHPLISRVNLAVARRCESLGYYAEAAAAYEAVVNSYPTTSAWRLQISDLRLQQAKCLYGVGDCEAAIGLAAREWEWKESLEGDTPLGARAGAIRAEMLRLCRRRDESNAAWSDLINRFGGASWFGKDWLRSEIGDGRGPLGAHTHRQVCAFQSSKRREVTS